MSKFDTRQFAKAAVDESEQDQVVVLDSKEAVRKFIELALEATGTKAEPGSDTERAAMEAVDDYETVRGEIEAEEDRDNLDQVRHQSEPTKAGALRKLANELQHERSLNGDSLLPADTSADDLLERLVQAVRDRRAGR